MSESEKPLQQESFLAQLNEVVAEAPDHHQAMLHSIAPPFEPAPTYVADLVVAPQEGSLSGNANGSEQPATDSHEQLPRKAPETSGSAPQAVTGNVKIQLMEISVEEFKANVDYIQSQFPSLPKRLICDSFSKANFDCRAAMELLTKEQEKKDQTIVPPLLLAARLKQQQQQPKPATPSQRSPTKSAAAAAAATAVAVTAAQQESPAAAAVTTTDQPVSSPAVGGARVTLPLPRGNRRSQAGRSPKEDQCYRRVVSTDKDAERALKQKLKSNVRSRVFTHGVKVSEGRESGFNRRGQASINDAESSVDTSVVEDEDDSRSSAAVAAAITNPTTPRLSQQQQQPERHDVDIDVDAEAGGDGAAAAAAELEDASEPQTALRILRDSFPSLPEVRLAECLADCNQDVDAAIKALSNRRFDSGAAGDSPGEGGSGARFFKSKQSAGKVQQARKDYVRAELNSGAWMGRQAGGAVGGASGGGGPATTLRVYTVTQKKRLTAGHARPSPY